MDPATIYNRFPTEADCITYLEHLRWSGKPRCPRCGLTCSTPCPREQRHRCNRCAITYSVTVGTVFHNTRLPLRKWFVAISLIIAANEGRMTARLLAKLLQINKNSACDLMNRVERALKDTNQATLLKALIADIDPAHPLVTLSFKQE